MKSKITTISDDASFRKFYRLTKNKKNTILVYAKKEKYQNLIAYTSVNKFLREKKILAPKLYKHNLKKGLIIIEDFGKLSFHKVLLKKKNKFAVYKKLVDLLIKIQKIKPTKRIKSIINKPHKINKYSIKYLQKESNLFFDSLSFSKFSILVLLISLPEVEGISLSFSEFWQETNNSKNTIRRCFIVKISIY